MCGDLNHPNDVVIFIFLKTSIDKPFFSRTRQSICKHLSDGCLYMRVCMWACASRAYDHFNVLRCCRAGMLLMFLRQPRGFSRGLCWPRGRRADTDTRWRERNCRWKWAEKEEESWWRDCNQSIFIFSTNDRITRQLSKNVRDDLTLTFILCWKPWYGINYKWINAPKM